MIWSKEFFLGIKPYPIVGWGRSRRKAAASVSSDGPGIIAGHQGQKMGGKVGYEEEGNEDELKLVKTTWNPSNQ